MQCIVIGHSNLERIYESKDALKISSMPREVSIQCVVKQAFSVVWLQFMCV